MAGRKSSDKKPAAEVVEVENASEPLEPEVEVEASAPAVEAAPEPDEPEGRLDETVPGGRYRTEDGQLRNANGEPIKGKGTR